MYSDPFTNHEDLDMMTILDAQHRAEEETDNFTLTKMEDSTMAAPKKIVKKPETKPAEKKTPVKAETKPEASKKKPGAAPGPRTVPEGHIGLAGLSVEFKTTPAVIRRKLREAEIEKPENGWVFKDGSKLLGDVRKLLTAKPKAVAE